MTPLRNHRRAREQRHRRSRKVGYEGRINAEKALAAIPSLVD